MLPFSVPIILSPVPSAWYKTQNGTKPEVIVGQYGPGCLICDGKLCQLINVWRTHLTSCTSHMQRLGQAYSRWYRATPSEWNILVFYPVSSSDSPDSLLTSEGLAMLLPSLGSAVGSGVTCSLPWNRKGMISRSVLYETSITREHLLARQHPAS